MTTTDLDYIGALRTNASALVDAAERAGVDATVPSCPEWRVVDLLEHIGIVHRWAEANLDRAPTDPYVRSRDFGIEVPDDPSARPGWVREGAEHLARTLATRDPDDPCWTWAPPHTVGFWQRRQAHETAVHRLDAQLAAGTPEPIDAPLAADAIDEYLSLLPNMPWRKDETGGTDETIHLHCDDVDGEWLIRLGSSGLEVERTHAKGDVAARGNASDVLSWLLGRGSADPLEVFGDAALLERWRSTIEF